MLLYSLTRRPQTPWHNFQSLLVQNQLTPLSLQRTTAFQTAVPAPSSSPTGLIRQVQRSQHVRRTSCVQHCPHLDYL